MPDDAPPVNKDRRRFLTTCVGALGGVGALCAVTPFVASWMPSESQRVAGRAVHVDLTHLLPGQQMTVEWRGQPIWIIHRTPTMLAQLQKNTSLLRDPDSKTDQQPLYAKNLYRSIKRDYLVLVGLCTHLGCVPNYKPEGDTPAFQGVGGFFCPCHGSTFDLSGRVFQSMPAPLNLKVPPHYYLNDQTLVIGEDRHE